MIPHNLNNYDFGNLELGYSSEFEITYLQLKCSISF